METASKSKCVHCGKTLVKMGSSRKNGKSFNDWETRKLHKRCYFERKEAQELEQYRLRFLEEQFNKI